MVVLMVVQCFPYWYPYPYATHGAGIFTNMCPKNQQNVGRYSIHGAYGLWLSHPSISVSVPAGCVPVQFHVAEGSGKLGMAQTIKTVNFWIGANHQQIGLLYDFMGVIVWKLWHDIYIYIYIYRIIQSPIKKPPFKEDWWWFTGI